MPYPEGLGHCRRRVRPVQTPPIFAHRRSNHPSPPQLPVIATVIHHSSISTVISSTLPPYSTAILYRHRRNTLLPPNGDTYSRAAVTPFEHGDKYSEAAVTPFRANHGVGTSTATLQSRHFEYGDKYSRAAVTPHRNNHGAGTSTAMLQSRRFFNNHGAGTSTAMLQSRRLEHGDKYSRAAVTPFQQRHGAGTSTAMLQSRRF
jgi:hypothetical protein